MYRLRRVGSEDIDYIGQTGLSLRKRLAMLRGLYSPEMPFRDPHTAAPALWALRHLLACSFQVSVCPILGDPRSRKGLEALAIALHRQEWGRSPALNFGRMPRGYQMSSGNNATLVAANRRFRGGPTEGPEVSWTSGIPPRGPLEGGPITSTWCGHEWSAWLRLRDAHTRLAEGAYGLYRIRSEKAEDLLYIGEGKVRERLRAHLAKVGRDHQQGQLFSAAGELRCSWTLSSTWLAHQRLELETDLIAAHMLATGQPPVAQFLG